MGPNGFPSATITGEYDTSHAPSQFLEGGATDTLKICARRLT